MDGGSPLEMYRPVARQDLPVTGDVCASSAERKCVYVKGGSRLSLNDRQLILNLRLPEIVTEKTRTIIGSATIGDQASQSAHVVWKERANGVWSGVQSHC
jgi:hypothetical protein